MSLLDTWFSKKPSSWGDKEYTPPVKEDDMPDTKEEDKRNRLAKMIEDENIEEEGNTEEDEYRLYIYMQGGNDFYLDCLSLKEATALSEKIKTNVGLIVLEAKETDTRYYNMIAFNLEKMDGFEICIRPDEEEEE